jgi:membrane fusion protein, multidrug efflux system
MNQSFLGLAPCGKFRGGSYKRASDPLPSAAMSIPPHLARSRQRSQASRRLVPVLVALLIAACSPPEGHDGATGQVRTTEVDVVTAAAVTKPLAVEIEAVGTARARESVDITSKASNTVTAIRFDEGDRVRRGAVLVELDGAEARAALAEAEAALADSQSQFNRSRELFAQQALSRSQLDQIEATLKGNQARVDVARARVADTVIRAGFAGVTGFRRVSVGSLVSPGSVITTLDDTATIKLDFTVPETYLFVIKRGLPVVARSVGLPGRDFTGQVTNLDSRVDPVTRSITVRAQIPNEGGLLRPGMFMTVKLQGEAVTALVVPEAAIVPEQGRVFVFVVRDGRVERREVQLGKRRPGEVELVAGLQAGERVITEGTQNVRDGTPVREQSQG